jgi:hypothetical protein
MNFWRGVVLPAAVPALAVAGFWALSWALLKGPRTRFLISWGLAGGYLLVHPLSGGSFNWRPIDVTEWLPYIALITALVGTFAEYNHPRASLGTLFLTGVILIIFAVLLLDPLREDPWTGARGWLLKLSVGILWWALGGALLRAGNESGWEMPLFSAILLALSGGVLFYGRSALVGQLTGSFASVVGVGTLFALILKDFTLGRGGMLVVGSLTGALYLIAYAFAQLPFYQLALLLLSWFLLSASTFPRRDPPANRWRWTFRLLSLGLAITALILGYTDYIRDSTEYGY